jgi:hypothetical protein
MPPPHSSVGVTRRVVQFCRVEALEFTPRCVEIRRCVEISNLKAPLPGPFGALKFVNSPDAASRSRLAVTRKKARATCKEVCFPGPCDHRGTGHAAGYVALRGRCVYRMRRAKAISTAEQILRQVEEARKSAEGPGGDLGPAPAQRGLDSGFRRKALAEPAEPTAPQRHRSASPSRSRSPGSKPRAAGPSAALQRMEMRRSSRRSPGPGERPPRRKRQSPPAARRADRTARPDVQHRPRGSPRRANRGYGASSSPPPPSPRSLTRARVLRRPWRVYGSASSDRPARHRCGG